MNEKSIEIIAYIIISFFVYMAVQIYLYLF